MAFTCSTKLPRLNSVGGSMFDTALWRPIPMYSAAGSILEFMSPARAHVTCCHAMGAGNVPTEPSDSTQQQDASPIHHAFFTTSTSANNQLSSQQVRRLRSASRKSAAQAASSSTPALKVTSLDETTGHLKMQVSGTAPAVDVASSTITRRRRNSLTSPVSNSSDAAGTSVSRTTAATSHARASNVKNATALSETANIIPAVAQVPARPVSQMTLNLPGLSAPFTASDEAILAGVRQIVGGDFNHVAADVQALLSKHTTHGPIRPFIVDTETTCKFYAGEYDYQKRSLVPFRPVEVYVQDVLTGQSFSTLVNPGGPIHSVAATVHKISQAMVTSAPSTWQAALALNIWILQQCMSSGGPQQAVLIAHNATFDAEAIAAMYVDAGIWFPDGWLLFDTNTLAQRLKLKQSGAATGSLRDLGVHLGVLVKDDELHRAKEDVLLLRAVMDALVKQECSGMTLTEAVLQEFNTTGKERILKGKTLDRLRLASKAYQAALQAGLA